MLYRLSHERVEGREGERERQQRWHASTELQRAPKAAKLLSHYSHSCNRKESEREGERRRERALFKYAYNSSAHTHSHAAPLGTCANGKRSNNKKNKRELQAANFTCSKLNGADNKAPKREERQRGRRQRERLSLTSLPACVQKLPCSVVCIKGRRRKRSARERK